MVTKRSLLAATVTLSFTLAACGGSNDAGPTTAPAATATSVETNDAAPAAGGVRVVSATEAALTIDDPPDDLVILDVRTQEEFGEGHIEGATMLDFYRPDFAEQLAQLDPDVPYVLYCRSGNRSGQTRAIMADLGFDAVDDIDGGIVAWQSAGLPVVSP
jgi:rhodanese-related sulfurtransferase